MQRNLVRIISTVAAAGLVAAVLATSAIANLEGCRNCIEAQDIAVGAVRAAELNDNLRNSIDANDIARDAIRRWELAMNSVGFSEMRNNAVGNNELRDGAVGADELMDESVGLAALMDKITPAAGFLDAGNFETTGNGTAPETLEQFNINVPGSGYLLVQVGGRLWLDNDEGGTTPADDLDEAMIGLCTNAATLTQASCGQADHEVRFFSALDTSTTENPTDVMYLARVVNPSAAGTQTLYLNAQASTTGDVNPAALHADGVQVTALFIPATLTVTAGT